MGVSEAFFLPAALAWIASYHGDRTRALATGLLLSGNYMGIVIGGAGGGWVADRFGWRAAFLLLGGVGIAYALILWLATRLRSRKMESVQTAPLVDGMREVLRLPGFPQLTLIFAAVSTANWVAYTWLPLHLYERLHMSLADAGFTATFYVQAGGFAGIVLGGMLADRWIAHAARGRLWTQALGLTAAAPFLFVAGSVSSWTVLVSSLLCFGMGRGMFDSKATPVLCQIARRNCAPPAMVSSTAPAASREVS